MNIKMLEKQIIEASKRYYTNGSSTISDSEFDVLVDELRKLDPQNPILTAVGWGWIPEKGAKHHYDLIEGISDKRKIDCDDVVDNGSATYTSKLDGCSVCHYYKNGNYYQSITRGDGVVGTDVTHNVKDKLPQLPEYFTGYVRTECVVSYTNFRNHFLPDKSIRNIATGIITAKENKPLLKYVDLVPISVYNAHPTINCNIYMDNYEFNSISKYFEHNIKCVGVVGEEDIMVIEGKPVYNVNENYDSKMKFGEDIFDELRCDYPSDGYICYKDGEILCAYKFDGEILETEVLHVEGKTKPTTRIQPRIFIVPTQISDCTCRKVTGKSGEAILTGKVGKGAIIEIIRSGEVVPNWTKNVIKESDDVWVPKCSYGCDENFVKRTGANFYCTNPDCPSILDGTAEKLIRHFAPKGFRTDMLEEMFDYFGAKYNSSIDTPVLKQLLDEVMVGDDGVHFDIGTTDHQVKMINQTMSAMKKGVMSLYDLVSICSIEAFGKTLSEELEPKLREWNNKINEFGIDSVSLVLINKKTFTADEVNNSKARDSWANRHDLLCQVMKVFEIVVPTHKPMGKNGTVCISGTLPSGTKKADFASVIEFKGYTWVDKLKKDTTILISSLPNSGKSLKAKKNGTKIMTEDEFNGL